MGPQPLEEPVEGVGQEEAKRLLRSLDNGGGDQYFFAYEFDGLCLVLPPQPDAVVAISATRASACKDIHVPKRLSGFMCGTPLRHV